MDVLELSFNLNTRSGIMANMPLQWYDSEDNHLAVIERTGHDGYISINVTGSKDVILKWLFNLAQDGRYKLVFPPKAIARE
jgi:hypothetical protein